MFLQLLSTCLTLVFVSLFLVYWKVVRPGKRIYDILHNQGIPAEPFVPFIGQLYRLARYRKEHRIMKFYEELSCKHGLNFLFLLGPFPRLVIQDADLIGCILGRTHGHLYQKPLDLSFRLKPLIGSHNLLISNGNEHKRARKMLNPGFRFENLRSMVSIMTNETSKSIEILLQESSSNKAINLQKEMSLLTLTIIASSAFGENYETIDNARKVVCEAFIAALDAIVNRTLSLIDQIPFFSRLPFWGKDIVDRGQEHASIFVEQIITNRRKGRTKNRCEHEDMLDLLLHVVDSNGEHFTDDEIKEQAMALVLAGHQSTSDLMTWTLYILMTQPAILRDCQEEIDRILPNRTLPTYEKLADLHVCESIIQETLRLYPTLPFFVRQCVEEHTIETAHTRLCIPRNATILINTYLLHRQEKYWSNPLEFNYKRWMRDPTTGLKPKLTHPFCYLPFAAGTRNCIGQHFALLEAKVILAMFVQRCQFELEPKNQEIVADLRITMRPKFGLFSKISRRE